MTRIDLKKMDTGLGKKVCFQFLQCIVVSENARLIKLLIKIRTSVCDDTSRR